MITTLFLWWIGHEMNAPKWYFLIITIDLVFRLRNEYRTILGKEN